MVLHNIHMDVSIEYMYPESNKKNLYYKLGIDKT